MADLNCSGLIIVAIIMALLIFEKEFRPFFTRLPKFFENLVNIMGAAFSGDGFLVQCKLNDQAGNDHGEIEPPKATHVEQDKKDKKDKNLEEARKNGEASDPLDNYNEEKLMELEKARQQEIQFKEERKKKMAMEDENKNENIEGFSDKKLKVDSKEGEKEVFNIDKNLFEFKEAEAVCKYYGSEVATYDQVKQAYDKGANWCNYGWVKTGQAIYPIQKEFYDTLSDDQKKNNHCGPGPGIVGGFMPSRSLRLGVNCYGKKPNADPDRLLSVDSNTDQFVDNEKNRIMNDIANKIYENKVDFKPFSNMKYSDYSKDNTKYLDNALTTNNEPEIVETPVDEEKKSNKDLVENFVFENKGLSEEFYRVIETN
tara:strand:- start:462 stop:1571 length:1110 start_codon:yes stop_codon:yes gene_type:complete